MKVVASVKITQRLQPTIGRHYTYQLRQRSHHPVALVTEATAAANAKTAAIIITIFFLLITLLLS
jgi:hypothetical protein